MTDAGPAELAVLTQTLLGVMEELLDTEMAGKTFGEFLHDFVDSDLSVSEECLHLSVSTPVEPVEVQSKGKNHFTVFYYVLR